MKKINMPKLIWVSSIFIVLSIILLLVINYKINYEYLSYNYLYFYECNGNLCVSQTKDSSKLIFSEYKCEYEACPQFIKKVNDNFVILKKDQKYILYNYRNKKIISDSYTDYEFINNNYIIATLNDKKGIININNELIANMVFDEIGYKKDNYLSGYNLNKIIVKKNNLYGIISYKNGTIVEEIKYKEEEINTLLDIIKE